MEWILPGQWGRALAGYVALVVALMAAPSWAADEDDFYRGKTITIIIPIGPGGAYDAYARLVSRHLGKQLPGNPLTIARNMPGGGGVIASNHLYNVAPRDGTTLAIITSSFANEQLFGNPQIRYDARQLLAIGRLLDTTSVLFFWHTSPIKTLNDLLTKPATMAISSVNEIPAYRLTAMNRYLNTQLKAIPGYPSARDYVLAAERGETDGGTSTYIGLSQLFSKICATRRSTSWCSSRCTAIPICQTYRPCSSLPAILMPRRSSGTSSPTTRSAARCSRHRTCPPPG